MFWVWHTTWVAKGNIVNCTDRWIKKLYITIGDIIPSTEMVLWSCRPPLWGGVRWLPLFFLFLGISATFFWKGAPFLYYVALGFTGCVLMHIMCFFTTQYYITERSVIIYNNLLRTVDIYDLTSFFKCEAEELLYDGYLLQPTGCVDFAIWYCVTEKSRHGRFTTFHSISKSSYFQLKKTWTQLKAKHLQQIATEM